MANGAPRTWRDGDEPLYPVKEGRCKQCGELFVAGQTIQERPKMSLKLFHHDKTDCGSYDARKPVTATSEPPAPYVAGSDTSREAAALIGPKASSLRAKVLRYITHQGSRGATDDEIQEMLKMDPSTERPRRIELEEARLIEKTESTRYTRSGRLAGVYVATTTGIEWTTEVLDVADQA
jgi:hypothetical protein